MRYKGSVLLGPKRLRVAQSLRLAVNTIFISIFLSTQPAAAGPADGDASFLEVETNLPAVGRSAVAFGDYDKDGDLDLLLTGQGNSGLIAGVFRNDGAAGFFDIGAPLEGVQWSSVAWGDFDNDGDLDILVSGRSGSGLGIAKIYRNDGSDEFTDIHAPLDGASFSSVAWGDYDNDGDLDVLCTGFGNEGAPLTHIYRNDGRDGFWKTPQVAGAWFSSVAWGDYDVDGDLDILIAGQDTRGNNSSKVLKNRKGAFSSAGVALTGVFTSSANWGDFDADGHLDILLAGQSRDGEKVAEIYRSKGNGSFTKMDSGLSGVDYSSSAWGDYDNDGDLDILLTGEDSAGMRIAQVYANEDSVFRDIEASLPGVFQSSVAWGDYDSDGDLDFILTGRGADNENVTRLYENRSTIRNTRPTPPTNLASRWTVGDGLAELTLTWGPGTDAETPGPGLTYNVRIGTTPGGDELSASMADNSSGFRRIPAMGNANHSLTWSLRVPETTFYWSVQTVDSGLAGSEFEFEQTVTPGLPEFQELATRLPGMRNSALAFGDYDNDGDFDVLMAGQRHLFRYSTSLYRNDGRNTFVEIEAGLVGVERPAMAWGDYDNDGDLDILLTGDSGPFPVSKVYRNDGANTFSDIEAPLVGVCQSSASWGDYDNDGDLDILLTGHDGSIEVSEIYRNDGHNSFVNIHAGLAGASSSSAAWGDYDNDGDLDIVLVGEQSPNRVALVYRNDGDGTFRGVSGAFSGRFWHSAEWGDYDNDGDLDLLLGGDSRTSVYLNVGGDTFSNLGIDFADATGSFARWGDYDNDGDLDVLVVSDEAGKLYRNEIGGRVTDLQIPLPALNASSVAWGDFDNDRDLDILLTGGGLAQNVTKIFENLSENSNTLPGPPTNLAATWSGSSTVTFSWDTSNDTETPQAGLTYNLRIGTTPGGSEISSAMADLSSGHRQIPSIGNVNQALVRTYEVSSAPLYWAVQAVDNAFEGSLFSREHITQPDVLAPPEPAPLTTKFSFPPPKPNPSRGSAVLSFTLPTPEFVDLTVYDSAGRHVQKLVSSVLRTGHHQATWDGLDEDGEPLAPGIYFARIRAGAFEDSRRLVRVR